MFALTQIQDAHSKVKSGADFPQYARDLVALGVTGYDTFVSDGHAVYLGNPEPLISAAKYDTLDIADTSDKEHFIERLRLHQSGGTDYKTFCQDCAKFGVKKWTLDFIDHTCIYFDTAGNTLLVEHFPE